MSKQAEPSGTKPPKSIVIQTSSITSETEEEVSSEPKLSHICIYGDCQKGKRGGSDYCRIHNTPSIKKAQKTSTKNTSKPSRKKSNKSSIKKSNKTSIKKATIHLENPNKYRDRKAIIGLIMMIIGPYIASSKTIFDDGFCFYYICCLFLMGAGFSLIMQSLHKSEVKTSTGINYFFLFFALIIIFIFASTVLF